MLARFGNEYFPLLENIKVLHVRCQACGIHFERPAFWFKRNSDCPTCGGDIAGVADFPLLRPAATPTPALAVAASRRRHPHN